MEYKSDDDLLGEERDLSGFLVPGSSAVASPGFSSPGSAGFGSPGFSSPRATDICKHGNKSNSCKQCFNEFNEDRKLKGLAPIAWGIFCKHGINKYKPTNKCPYIECNEKRPYTKTFAHSAEESQPLYQQGVIPDSARMFEPPIPKSAGLSFSPLEASQVNPVNRNLFGPRVFYSSDEGEMGGGRRKSSKKSKRKSSKKSKRKSSKKAKKLKRR
jgi:hypothetical protein